MRVFKACLIVMKRHISAIIVYLVVFMGLAIIIAKFNQNAYTPDFEVEKPEFSIVDRDGSTLSQSMAAYMESYGTPVVLEDDPEALQDAVFFHAAEVIFIIPEGFGEDLKAGRDVTMDTMSRPDSTYSYYLTSLADQYWNSAAHYHELMPELSDGDIAKRVMNSLSVSGEVEKKLFSEKPPVPNAYIIFMQIQPYIILVLIILCTSTIFMAFRRPDLQMRNLCSPMKSGKLSVALMAYAAMISMGVWLLLNLIGIIWCREALASVDLRILGLLWLNSFCYMLVCMNLSLVVTLFIRSSDAQNSAANFLSLGMSFIGGVFVPQEMLGDMVLAVARFTPTYWYVANMTRICKIKTFDATMMRSVYSDMLIQLAFAAALFCVFLALNKYRNRAEQSFGSIKTQTEQ